MNETPLTPAQQLIHDLTEARAGQDVGTLDGLYPQKMFRHDIGINYPDGRFFMVNPQACLTDFACQELIAALETRGLKCSILPGGGVPNFTGMVLRGGFSYSGNANWLLFETSPGQPGMPINAGVLYDYFNHGYPAHYALNLCESELAQDAYFGGYSTTPPNIPAIMANTQD